MSWDDVIRPATLLALGLWMGAGCGGSSSTHTSSQGLKVVVESDAAFTRAPDFEARLDDTVEVALRYWGGTDADVQGRTLTLVDTPSVPCGDQQTLGCFDGNIRLTTRDPGIGTFACIEQTTLVHEIGHAVIGDPMHTDPRWMEMDSVAQALDGRTGYEPTGVEPCVTYVSVWQHLLNSP